MLVALALAAALDGFGCCPSNPDAEMYLFDVAVQAEGYPALQMMAWQTCGQGTIPWVVGTTYPGAPTYPMGTCDVLVPDPVLGTNLMQGQAMWDIFNNGGPFWLVESDVLHEDFPPELHDQDFTFQLLLFDFGGLAATSNPVTVSVYK